VGLPEKVGEKGENLELLRGRRYNKGTSRQRKHCIGREGDHHGEKKARRGRLMGDFKTEGLRGGFLRLGADEKKREKFKGKYDQKGANYKRKGT